MGGGGLETPLNKSQLPSKLSVSRLFLLVTEDQLVLLTGVLLTVGGLAANAAFFPRLRHPPIPACVCASACARQPSRGIPSITGRSGPQAETGSGVADSGRRPGR